MKPLDAPATSDAVPSLASLRSRLAVQDACSEGGKFAEALAEADRKLLEAPEDVRTKLLAALERLE